MHKKSYLQLCLAMLTGMLLAACEQTEPTAEPLLQLVATAPVSEGQLLSTHEFSGVSRSVERAELAFQSSGILQLRPVDLGDYVEAGSLLAALDNPELKPQQRASQAALARAQAERAQVERNVKRYQTLVKDQLFGEQQLEEEQTRLDSLNQQIAQAQAELARSQERLSDASLVAPFSGLIGQVNFEPGEFVTAGQTVIVLGNIEQMEVLLEVPTKIWTRLKVGDTAEVTVLGVDEKLQGSINEIGSLADPATGLFPITVSYPASRMVQAGQRVIVQLHSTAQTALQVPIQAIVDPIGGAPKVYRIASNQGEIGVIESVPVHVTGYANQQVAIESSQLQVGDQVVTAGYMSLVDGEQVKLLTNQQAAQ